MPFGTIDAHIHLNGSFTLPFLKETAMANGKMAEYDALDETIRIYREKSKNVLKIEESIHLIWKQFGLIHKIIQRVEDIKKGTIDVVNSSKAQYLEIRTTPKPLGENTWQDYVDAFIEGLLLAREASGKSAYGLLSLDRTRHHLSDGIAFVDRVIQDRAQGKDVLVGIDIGGDPSAQRTLTGNALRELIQYAFSKDVSMAIHVGEINTELERDDVDVILSTLKQWVREQKTTNKRTLFQGKIRLGHAIHLSETHIRCIRDFRIPVEVCPSCHRRVDWWSYKDQTAHPATRIYNSWRSPIVSGTDDPLIFHCDASSEKRALLEEVLPSYQFRKKSKTEHDEEVDAHQSQYMFAGSMGGFK